MKKSNNDNKKEITINYLEDLKNKLEEDIKKNITTGNKNICKKVNLYNLASDILKYLKKEKL